MKKNEKFDSIKCPKCDYWNTRANYNIYGTCTRCGTTLDEKIKFKYEMNRRLRLWKGKFR